MKIRIKDRRMKERVVELRHFIEQEDKNFLDLFSECEVFQVKIEPIYGGIFGDI